MQPAIGLDCIYYHSRLTYIVELLQFLSLSRRSYKFLDGFILSQFILPLARSKALLVNTHATDVRLPWWQYMQPSGLLQLANYLSRHDVDVRFIDCLRWNYNQSITRKKVKSISIEGHTFDLWRYGASIEQLNEYFRKLRGSGFEPEIVYVSCANSTWWYSVKEFISYVKRKWLPTAKFVLGGSYAIHASDHAKEHSGADFIVDFNAPHLSTEPIDFRFFEEQHKPHFAGLYLYSIEVDGTVKPKAPHKILDEIVQKVQQDEIREFGFFDMEVLIDYKEHFIQVLENIIKAELDIRFVSLGNMSPLLIDDTLARLLKGAGFKRMYLKCDVSYSSGRSTYSTSFNDYAIATEALANAGFRLRTDDVTAMVLVGHPDEDIGLVAERLIKLASIVGAVGLVQYQYSPFADGAELYRSFAEQTSEFSDPMYINSRLYLLAQQAGIPLDDYIELTRLAALLNSKYRSRTFNFLGVGLIAREIQRSIGSNSWQPIISNKSRSNGYGIIPIDEVEQKMEDNL